MSFEQVVKTTLQPAIPLKELFEEDTSSEGSSKNQKTPGYLPSAAEKIGVKEPYVKLAGILISGVEKLTIDETGFLPTVSMTFMDAKGNFAGSSFPKTDFILEVYLKVGNDRLKPIRCDFIVTSIRSIAKNFTGEKRGYGRGTTYMIKGELYVPKIYKNVSKSYPNLSSRDALFKVAQELGLGFAENNNAPIDKMTWINPNTNYMDFIQSVAKHAYEGENSFFSVFIDKYYILNYIEVNKQLKTGDFDTTLANYTEAIGADVNQQTNGIAKSTVTEEFIPNYLTTEIKFKGKSNYVSELNLLGDQGEIIKNKGSRKRIYYYDHLRKVEEPKQKIINFYKESIKSEDRPRDQYLIPTDIDLAQTEVKKWIGIDYGNTHPEYVGARLINAHNLVELNKINLKVNIRAINFQVIRGSRIPVVITLQEAERLSKTSGVDEAVGDKKKEKGAPLSEETFDEDLTGYYYVLGAKYYYDTLERDKLYTELILARREWRPSKTLPDI
jgi:hypothetical protein